MLTIPDKMLRCQIVLERCDDQPPTSVASSSTESKSRNYSPCPICRKELYKTSMQIHILRKHKKIKAFICSFCPKEFYAFEEMQRHVSSHTKERPHICSICNEGSITFESMYNHNKIHFESKYFTTSVTYKDYIKSRRLLRPSFKCKSCSIEFKDFQGITDHIKPYVKCLKCVDCGSCFPSPKDMKGHQEETGDLECKFCFEAFTSPCHHRKHEADHTEDFLKTNKCPQCPATLSNIPALKLHIQKNHSAKVIRTRCPTCKLICQSKMLLNLHQALCHSESTSLESTNTKPQCHICGEKIVTNLMRRQTHLGSYVRHILKYHMKPNSEDEVGCVYCDKLFVKVKDDQLFITHLKFHFKKMSTMQSVDVKCKICQKSYPSKDSLAVHMRYHRKGTICCNVCGKTFISMATFNEHMRRHLKETPYKCEECGKAWVTSGDLKKHLKSHSNVKNYPCQYCGKCFGIVENRRRHERTVHSESKVSCSVCSKTFSHWNYLRDHLVVHSESKEFQCKFCDNAYKSRPNMYRHIREAHQDQGNEV